jgi:hypothetical protein
MQSENTQFRWWFRVALINLLLASLLGVLLRLAFLVEIPWFAFKNLLHGHSHMAMIGWGYLAIYALLMQYFGRDFMHQQVFRLLYFGNQIAAVGMFLTFPVYGYTGIPIFFTTVHLILTYVFAYYFLSQLSKYHRPSIANAFIWLAIIFHILSTIAIWMLPFLIANGLRHSASYHMAVQFFLHFQFNGWFIFAVLGIFFKLIEPEVQTLRKLDLYLFLTLLCIATITTYAMAVTWSTPLPFVFLANSVGVIIQLASLAIFIRILRHLPSLYFTGLAGVFFRISLACFVLKILMQSCVVSPHIAVVAYTIRNFVVGFIHLILLGTLTSFIFATALELNWLRPQIFRVKLGLSIFLLGFTLSETLLFFQGTLLWAQKGFLPSYYLLLFVFSLLLPLGISLLIETGHKKKLTPD